jgi:hypothetical protein
MFLFRTRPVRVSFLKGTKVMTPEERQLLTELFDRVRSASGNNRDPEAEAFIADQVRAQPYAPYLMAQAVIVQEEGLKKAAARIEDLERALANQQQGTPQSGSFLGSVFGGGRSSVPSAGAPRPTGPWGAGSVPSVPQQAAAPQQMQQPQGGSFLRNALGMAAGVAGGVLLANSLSSLFSGSNNTHGIAGNDAGASASNASQDITGGVFDPPSTPSVGSDYIQPASYDDGGGWDSGGDGSFDT